MYSDFFSRQVEEKSFVPIDKVCVKYTGCESKKRQVSAGRVTGIATGLQILITNYLDYIHQN